MAREMKNSGLPWAEEIPLDWSMPRLRDVALFFNGDRGANYPSGNDLVDEGVPFLTSNNLHQLELDTESSVCKYITPERYIMLGGAKIKLNDIIYCLRGSIGNCSINKRLTEGTVASSLMVIRPTQIIPEYLNYVLHSNIASAQTDICMNGTCAANLSAESVSKYRIPIPPIQEEKAIADFLDAKCSEIDGLLADLDAEVKTLGEYKKSIIAETVTRGLNPNAPMKDSGIPWVGDMPNHWKVIANKYIMHKKKEIVPIYGGQDIISLSMNGVIVRDLDAGGKMPTSFNGYQHIYPGNLLMCLFDIDVTPRCIGLIKNDGLTSPAYSQFVMNGEAFAPYYYYFYLKMDNDKELVHLSKNMRHSLNEEQFGMIKTILPPREEQETIANYLDEKCATIEQSIADKLTQIETLKAYKSSLIYEYVTGKKQVAL